ncbi:MAG: hypothetical protein M2R45_01620 [Verrucomicrobia subdivision 3 bacterium]|nr:hypothetical protein [Limisphaerales bacterium]MCS1412771.1 hypothetical protein [Limisphaerales bacterium]
MVLRLVEEESPIIIGSLAELGRHRLQVGVGELRVQFKDLFGVGNGGGAIPEQAVFLGLQGAVSFRARLKSQANPCEPPRRH